jgi:hypothetical protein
MCLANPLWGAPRIHGEMLKVGIKVSQATVAKYMLRRPHSPSSNWRSFLYNHALGVAAIDMFIVPSATFRLLFVMLILAHDRRKIVRFDVTLHPTAGWLSRQVTEAFPWDTAPRFLLRDRDSSYGPVFSKRVDAMDISEVLTAPRSPWQNPYVERAMARSGANVWTTSLSSTSAICVAPSRLTRNTITEPERICSWGRTVPILALCIHRPAAR